MIVRPSCQFSPRISTRQSLLIFGHMFIEFELITSKLDYRTISIKLSTHLIEWWSWNFPSFILLCVSVEASLGPTFILYGFRLLHDPHFFCRCPYQ